MANTNKKMTIENLVIITKEGFDKVDKKFDEVDKKFDKVDKTIESLAIITKESFDEVDKKFDKVDKRFDKVEGKINQLPTKEYLDDKLADLRGDIIILLRREDKRLQMLIDKLREKNILKNKDIKELEESKIFVQQI